MKNNNADRVNRCDFDYILVDSAGHQLNETFIVADDGYHGDEIFSGVEITSREWFETQNNITGDIMIYVQPSSNILGNNNETCPGFEIKLDVPENQILTPQQLVLLDDETVAETNDKKHKQQQ